MPIGDPQDFRMKGFNQVEVFGAQDVIGGEGSAALYHSTKPYGSSNMQFPVPPLTFPNLQNPTITFPTITLPSIPPPVINIGGTGATAPTAINVNGTWTTGTPGSIALTNISTLNFIGTGLLSVSETPTGTAQIEYQDTGGTGGSSLVYGKIKSVTRPTGTIALWQYTVTIYTAGSAGSDVTAYNLLEKENTSTSAYGITVTGGDRIGGTATNYYVRSVPVNAWVRMELTSDVSGTSTYWFSAPNPITGTC